MTSKIFNHASSTHQRSYHDDLHRKRVLEVSHHDKYNAIRERTSRLGVLSPNTKTPVVPETTVRADLLQSLEVVTELRVDGVRQNLAVLAIDDVPLPVQKPGRNLELGWVLNDGDQALELIRVELASPTIPLCEDVKC